MDKILLGNVKGPQGEQGPQGIQGEQGSQGEPGKSAYEAAIEGGFTGSEGAFNAALGAFGGVCTLLWTNTQPTVSFPARTVTVPGLSEYDTFLIVLQRSTGDLAATELKSEVCYVPSGTLTYCAGGFISVYQTITVSSNTSEVTYRGMAFYSRNVTITPVAETVDFSAGYENTSGGAVSESDSSCIPVYILGISRIAPAGGSGDAETSTQEPEPEEETPPPDEEDPALGGNEETVTDGGGEETASAGATY